MTSDGKLKGPLRCLGAVVVLLGLAAPARAQLDGLSEIGHSYQSDARGGCEVSIGDTALAHVRQPASVVLQSGAKFDSKITNLFPVDRWNDIDDSTFSTVDMLLSYNLGAVTPLGERFAAGIAWEVGGWSTRFDERTAFPDVSTPIDTSVGLKKYSVYANLGAKITERWSVGGGPHIEILRFSTDLIAGRGLLSFPGAESVGAGYQLGTLYKLTEKVQLGASYASPTYMGALSTTGAQFIATSGERTSGPLSIRPFSLPGRVSFGASMGATEKLKVALEGGYLNYGDSFFGDVSLEGLVNGRFRPGFQDIWVINTGLDYDFSERWSGSLGYVYNTSPIDRQSMVPIFVSNGQNQFTWGLRYRRGRFWTGFAHVISLPSETDSTPTTQLALGPDYQDSSVRQVFQGLNYGFGFSF